MHHLEPSDRQEVLKELARVTKVGGYVLTFEHNPMNPLVRWIVSKCDVDKGVDLIYPTDMMCLHRDTGLQILGIKYLNFFPKLLSFMGSLEFLFHWIPFGGQYEVIAKKISHTPTSQMLARPTTF